VARTIAEALAQADPGHAADYRARAETFATEADAAFARQKQVADGLPAKLIFTYHRSWSYFVGAFGLDVAENAEPVPGIPPTARHLADLVAMAKSRHVTILLQEPYFSADAGQFLAREAGVRAVTATPCCDDVTAGRYLAHFDSVLSAIATAMGGKGTP
jgi:ABC-type Zn uptake system ZnuABC Zn-binding protein ZnuA